MSAASSWEAPSLRVPLDASVPVPGSKSVTARALYLAAIADSPSRITGALDSRDTRLLRAALETMGARIHEDGADLVVTPMTLPPRGGHIDCGLAGTVMRFLPPLAALSEQVTTFDGDEQAYARPLAPLLDALERMGASITYHGSHGHLPFSISGPLRTPLAGQAWVDASSSSQFLSALLLVSPLVGDPLFVSAPGHVVSMPHVDMTVATMMGAGVDVEVVDEGREDLHTWHVFPGRPAGGDYHVEPDLSNAGPFLAAAMVAGGRVRIPHWPAATTQAGDAWRNIVAHMGAKVYFENEALVVEGPGAWNYPGIDANMSEVGELTPTLAALCVYASSPSRLAGVAHLRGHETNRLAALVAEINRAGGEAIETEDGLEIHPRPLHGALLRSYADHRMATFGAILGLATPGISVDDIACTSKTLPSFEDMWAQMLASREGESA